MIPFLAGAQVLSLGTKIAIATTLAAALFSFGLYLGNKIGVSSCYEATITDVAETVAGNYGICEENSSTLSALQDWVREQSLIR
jgi:hypothetical protein